MYHRLCDVAESKHFDEADFVAYARANESRYGIIESGPHAMVNTWNVDGLAKAFLEAGHSRMLLSDWRERYGYPAGSLRLCGVVGMVETTLDSRCSTLAEAQERGRSWLEDERNAVDHQVTAGDPEAASYPTYYVVRDGESVQIYSSQNQPDPEPTIGPACG
jgi:hypothetical protein